MSQVYFLRRADGLIKIGFSNTFATRLATLTKSHGPLEVLRLINGDRRRERSVQSRLKRHHEYGEWFRDSEELRQAIADLPEGDFIEASQSDLEKDWAEGESSMAKEAADMAARLVQLRRQRTRMTNVECIRALSSDYGLRFWAIDHARSGRAATVSAFTYKRLREALVQELTTHRDHLLRDIEEAESLTLYTKPQETAA